MQESSHLEAVLTLWKGQHIKLVGIADDGWHCLTFVHEYCTM